MYKSKNLGKRERALRLVLAIILILVSYTQGFNIIVEYVFVLLGIYLFITVLLNTCPIYSISNYSSRGQGLDKITRRDIEFAIKDYNIKKANDTKVDVKVLVPKETKTVALPKDTKIVKSSAKKTSSVTKSKTTTKKKVPATESKKTATNKVVQNTTKPQKTKSQAKSTTTNKTSTSKKKPSKK